MPDDKAVSDVPDSSVTWILQFAQEFGCEKAGSPPLKERLAIQRSLTLINFNIVLNESVK